MKAKLLYVFKIMIVGVFCIPAILSSAKADIYDDFNDNSLDSSKWYTLLPFGGSQIDEVNQRIEMANRSYLVTQSQFAPSAAQPLTVTGRYKFTNATWPGHDNFQIVTRTSALPSGGYAEVSDGITGLIIGNNSLAITERSTGNVLAQTLLNVDDNDEFLFTFFDDGFHLSFSAIEIGGQGESAYLTASSTFASSVNHVAFYNRESNNGFNTLGYLDDVRISTIPEPASFGLLAIGAVVFGFRRFVRRHW